MLDAVSKLRDEVQAGDFEAAEQTAQSIDVQLVLDRGQTAGIYSELIRILQDLPDPQCGLGQWLVNILQWHRTHLSSDDAYELLRLCASQVGEVRHTGAHQSMAEALEDEELAIVAGDA